jgi:glutathione S-transferase
MPADPAGYALAEQWVSCVNTTIDPTCVRQYIVGYAFPGTPDGSPNRRAIDGALPNMQKQLPVLDKALAKTGHLVGDKLTLADINLFPDCLLFAAISREQSADAGAEAPDSLHRAHAGAPERQGNHAAPAAEEGVRPGAQTPRLDLGSGIATLEARGLTPRAAKPARLS